jgi:hypothetical protein
MARLRPLYCRHCSQTLYSDDMERCSGCNKTGGIVDPADPAAIEPLSKILDVSGTDEVAELVADKKREPASPLSGLRQAARTYFMAWLGCGGVSCLFVGFLLLVTPILWSEPRGPSFSDAVPGLSALLAGAILLFLLIMPLLPRGRGTKSHQAGPGSEQGARDVPATDKDVMPRPEGESHLQR